MYARNLIAAVIAALGLAATTAFADPTLNGAPNRVNAPEATSFVSDAQPAAVRPVEARQYSVRPVEAQQYYLAP